MVTAQPEFDSGSFHSFPSQHQTCLVLVTVCLPLEPLSEDLLSREEHEAGQGRGEAKTVSFIHLTSMIHQQQFLRDL